MVNVMSLSIFTTSVKVLFGVFKRCDIIKQKVNVFNNAELILRFACIQ